MRINIVARVAGIGIWLIFAGHAVAQQTYNYAGTDVYAGGNSGVEASDFQFTPVTENASSESSASTNFGDSSFVGTARASAGPDGLKTFVSVDMQNYAYESYSTVCPVQSSPGGTPLSRDPVSAWANLVDEITLVQRSTGGILNPNGVFLRFVLGVDGETSLDTDIPASKGPGAQGSLALSRPGTNFFFSRGYREDALYITGVTPVLFGVPTLFSLRTSAFISPVDYLLPDEVGTLDYYDLLGIADFGSTITINAIEAYLDEQATIPFTDFDLLSLSGYRYTTNNTPAGGGGNTVAEPSTLALLGIGLLLLVALTHRRDQRPHACALRSNS
jgi:hypothetical protein